MLFVQTANAVLKYANSHFNRAAGISITKFTVLRILAANGGTMTPTEIAQRTLTERHNITTLVDRLEHDGLVKTRRNDRDRRSVNVTLTNKGRELLTQAIPTEREIANQTMSLVTEGDIALMEKSLRLLRRNAHRGLEHVANCSQPRSDQRKSTG